MSAIPFIQYIRDVIDRDNLIAQEITDLELLFALVNDKACTTICVKRNNNLLEF